MQVSLVTLTIFFPQILRIQCDTIKDPTLKPAILFSAINDAEIIRDELKSMKIDRDKIAKLYFHRTYQQRREIQIYYDQKYCPNGDTWKPFEYCPFHGALKDISTESLDDLYDISLTPPEGIYAQTIHHAIESEHGEVGALEEAVCANDKETTDLINTYYRANYGTTVEEHLATFKKDDQEYQNVMLKYCWKGLSQEKKLSLEDIVRETKTLRKLHRNKDWDGFKKKLIELLDNTSEPDLQQIFLKYRHDKKGIGKAVEDVFEEDRQKRAYNVLARYIENTARYYAEMLLDTVDSQWAFVKSKKINRIILTRCERDLGSIFKEYYDNYEDTFPENLEVIDLVRDSRRSICAMYWIPKRQTLNMKHFMGDFVGKSASIIFVNVFQNIPYSSDDNQSTASFFEFDEIYLCINFVYIFSNYVHPSFTKSFSPPFIKHSPSLSQKNII